MINKIILIELIDKGLTNKEISEILGISRSSVVRSKSFYSIKSKYSLNKRDQKKCLYCNEEFISLKSEIRKFCSKKCSVTFSNIEKGKNNIEKNKNIKVLKDESNEIKYLYNCKNCKEDFEVDKREASKIRKYCSHKCHKEFEEKIRYTKIENNEIVSNKSVKSYLIKKYGEKCMDCGWCEIHKLTKKVPIELEHIDGNSENNNLENLKLLCPNCHSLTITYKALNKGNGRYKRRERYNKNKSY